MPATSPISRRSAGATTAAAGAGRGSTGSRCAAGSAPCSSAASPSARRRAPSRRCARSTGSSTPRAASRSIRPRPPAPRSPSARPPRTWTASSTTCCSRRRAAGPTPAWARPARALPAAFVRHPPARRGRGPAGGTGAVGPRLARHHAGVYSYVGGTAEKGIPSGAPEGMTRIQSTTILAVRRDGHVALGGDGQVTLGDTVMKANANQVRTLSGGNYALAAARALLQQSELSPKEIVQRSLEIAAEICVYTNTHITILEL